MVDIHLPLVERNVVSRSSWIFNVHILENKDEH